MSDRRPRNPPQPTEDETNGYYPIDKRAWLTQDPWRDKRGRARTWEGHLRVLARQKGVPVKKLRERIGL